MAASRQQELDNPRDVAAALGRSAVEAARQGTYVTETGRRVDWRDAVQAACAEKVSIAPHAMLARHTIAIGLREPWTVTKYRLRRIPKK